MSKAIIPKGYIAISRQLLDSNIYYRKPSWIKMWLHILLKAHHSDSKKMGWKLSKGETFIKTNELIELTTYYQGNRPIPQENKNTVANFFKYLKKEKMVTTKRTTRGVIIKIVKYDFFQNPSNYENHKESVLENNNKTSNTHFSPPTIDKNDKKLKELKKERKGSGFSSIQKNLNSYSLTKSNGNNLTKCEIEVERFAEKFEINFEEIKPTLKVKWLHTFKFLHNQKIMGIAESAYSQLVDSPTEFKSADHLINTFLKEINTRLSNKK